MYQALIFLLAAIAFTPIAYSCKKIYHLVLTYVLSLKSILALGLFLWLHLLFGLFFLLVLDQIVI